MRAYRFVLNPRWMAFHALVWLILIPAFILLGYWQRTLWKDRADSQGLVYAKMDAKPVNIDAADPLGHEVSQAQQWVTVTATGHYDTAHEFAVPNRSQNENAGWYVVTPLVLPNGTAVMVNQGWIQASNSAVSATLTPPMPPVPKGTVTVSGYLQPDETTALTRITDDTSNLPHSQVALISKVDMQGREPYTLLDGSIQLISSTPANTGATAAQAIPAPSYDNTMYIAYMIQWWVFAIVMPITWLKLLHREKQELENRARAAAEEAEEAEWDEEDGDGEWDDEDEYEAEEDEDEDEDEDDEDWDEDEEDDDWDEEDDEDADELEPAPALASVASEPGQSGH